MFVTEIAYLYSIFAVSLKREKLRILARWSIARTRNGREHERSHITISPRILVSLDVINVAQYYGPMIISFKDKDTELLNDGVRVARFAAFERIALRKLRQLQIANTLDDLRVPPGNRLEALKGDRKGQYSIRINDQYRVCFTWMDGGAQNVEIVDYH